VTRSLVGLAGWIAAPLAVGWFASRFRPGPWYAALDKPAWTPPDAAFAPVWTVLYVAMGVAAWLAWRGRGGPVRAAALTAFAVQLALNAAWSWLFFGEHRPGAALADLVLLWIAIAVTAGLFARRSRVAAALLVPYLAWVTYAGALNASIVARN